MDNTNTVLDDVANTIGYTATLTISAWYGGTNLYVPQRVSDKHPIAKAIGTMRFAKLVDEFGGGVIAVPDDIRREVIDRRNKVILDYLAAGATTAEISRKTGITKRWVDSLTATIGELDPEAAKAGITSREVMDAIAAGEFAERGRRGRKKAPGKAPLEKPPGKATPEKPPRKSHPRKATPFDALLPVGDEQ